MLLYYLCIPNKIKARANLFAWFSAFQGRSGGGEGIGSDGESGSQEEKGGEQEAYDQPPPPHHRLQCKFTNRCPPRVPCLTSAVVLLVLLILDWLEIMGQFEYVSFVVCIS